MKNKISSRFTPYYHEKKSAAVGLFLTFKFSKLSVRFSLLAFVLKDDDENVEVKGNELLLRCGVLCFDACKPNNISRGEGEAGREMSSLIRRLLRHEDDNLGEADGVVASKLSKGLLVMLGECLNTKLLTN